MRVDYAVERILDHFPRLSASDVVYRLRYSTFVNTSRRYLYFEVPKAACTQMKHLLRHLEGAPPIDLLADANTLETRRDLYVHARANVPLPSLADLDSSLQREVLESPDFLRITVVRSPYTRLVSAWRNKVLLCDGITGKNVYLQLRGRLPGIHEDLPIPFDEFVRYVERQCDLPNCDIHWVRQVDYNFFPAMNYSWVGEVERLEETVRRLEAHLGLSGVLAVDRRNESLPVGQALFTEELADAVYALYRSDFELLGYDRESWRRVAGPHSAGRAPEQGTFSEERLRDEIVERNLVILSLYEDRKRLQAQLRRVSRLHLIQVANTLAAWRSKLRWAVKFTQGCSPQDRSAESPGRIGPCDLERL